MKVKELRDWLYKFPDDADVILQPDLYNPSGLEIEEFSIKITEEKTIVMLRGK